MYILSYSEKLKDPRWQAKRLEVFERDGFKCRCCESKTKTLNVHHQLYVPNSDPWDYPLELLLTLCEECHKEEERWKSCDFNFMQNMLFFNFTRFQINRFVTELTDTIQRAENRENLLNEIESIIKSLGADKVNG